MESIFEILDIYMTDAKTLAEQIGRRLARLRKAQGMTQLELASSVRLSQQLIAEYEAGRKNIPVWRLINMAEAMGIEPRLLIEGDENHKAYGRRGPPSKLQRQVERIERLPPSQQKSIMQVLDMALKSDS